MTSKNIADICVIGAGIAGTFAALKIARENTKTKVIVFDLGRPPLKRRSGRPEGFLGALPSGDGKLYINDLKSLKEIGNKTKIDQNFEWFENYCNSLFSFKLIKDEKPNLSVLNKIKKYNFKFNGNNYYQLFPKNIHSIIKDISEYFENIKNINFQYDNEVFEIKKQKNQFVIVSENGEFYCKKLLISVGRSGWRWVSELYEKFGIVKNNDYSYYGLRIEMPESYMKDYNYSNGTIKNDDLEIGPLSWSGTVIPEDHLNLAITSFRSNEERWKSDRVSFNFIKKHKFDKNGWEQSSRIGQLTWILSNDRILKEKSSLLLQDQKSKLSILPEYNWVAAEMKKVEPFIPHIFEKSSFHAPTILTMPPKIKIKKNLETEIDDMYVAGESAGVIGILAAAVSGLTASESLMK